MKKLGQCHLEHERLKCVGSKKGNREIYGTALAGYSSDIGEFVIVANNESSVKTLWLMIHGGDSTPDMRESKRVKITKEDA